MKQSIKIGKRGAGLAFRIPKALGEKYNLNVGDSIDSELIERVLANSLIRRESKQP